MKFGMAQPIRRKGDAALLHGAGRCMADYTPVGTLQVVKVRSPHAHARFRITDVAKARALPGARLVLTADDIGELGSLPCVAIPLDLKAEVPPYPVLAKGEVRHVGDIVAFVAADTIDQAKDAAEAIAIEWQPLPHVVDAVSALKCDAPLVWPERAGNVAFEMTLGDAAKTAAAFTMAPKTVTPTLVNPTYLRC
jgi:aerobic carbon-monoxide dehydrogenase large subunit